VVAEAEVEAPAAADLQAVAAAIAALPVPAQPPAAAAIEARGCCFRVKQSILAVRVVLHGCLLNRSLSLSLFVSVSVSFSFCRFDSPTMSMSILALL
jgi:hypothetical protein